MKKHIFTCADEVCVLVVEAGLKEGEEYSWPLHG